MSLLARILVKSSSLWVANRPANTMLWANKRQAEKRNQQNSHRLNRGLAGRQSPSITIKRDNTLPVLAWRGVLSKGHLEFTVGPNVEMRDEGFFEGVWSGDFSDLSAAKDQLTFGSGAVTDADGVTILVPKCGCEQIYVLRELTRGMTHIANSLCHCLATAGIRSETPFFQALTEELHSAAMEQTRIGAIGSDPRLVSLDGLELISVYYNNFKIYSDGAIEFRQPYQGRVFDDFQTYRQFIHDNLGQIIANAIHPHRKVALAPIVTVSRGYDSPAVAVLAAEQGCKDALCFDVNVWGVNDSGIDIANALGLSVNIGQHFLGQQITTLQVEYGALVRERALEFVATAGLGDDIAYAAFEPWLTNRTLLTGAWGDSIWARTPTVYPGLPIRVWYGKSITEYRLRLGFAHVPVPMIGGFFPRSIGAISASAEMQPYSVGGAYDRPIPRRILEEAGIPRESFGTKKAAINPTPLNRAGLWRDAMIEIMRRYEQSPSNCCSTASGIQCFEGSDNTRY